MKNGKNDFNDTALSLPGKETVILKEMTDLQVKAVDAYAEKEFAKIKANPVGEREIYKHGANEEDLKQDPRTKVPVAEILKDQPDFLKQLIRSDVTGINLGEIDLTGNDKTNKKLMDKNYEGKVEKVTKEYVAELVKNAPAIQSGSVPHKQNTEQRHR